VSVVVAGSLFLLAASQLNPVCFLLAPVAVCRAPRSTVGLGDAIDLSDGESAKDDIDLDEDELLTLDD
jgi:hypothetical protein